MKINPTGSSIIREIYKEPAREAGSGFKEMLNKMVGDVDSLQNRASDMTRAAIAGAPVEVHDVMIASEEARLAFDLMLEIRNRLLEAYREITQMRM